MITNRYAPPTAPLDVSGQLPVQMVRVVWLLGLSCGLELVSFAVTWLFGAPWTDVFVTFISVGLLGLWFALVGLAWLTSRRHNVAGIFLLALLALVLLYLLAAIALSASLFRGAGPPAHLVWRLRLRLGIDVLQFMLCVVAIS